MHAMAEGLETTRDASQASAIAPSGGWTLVVVGRALRSYALAPGAELVIGRDPACAVPLDHDRVSRRHARLTFGAGSWRVENLGIRNGTEVGNVRELKNVLDRALIFADGERIEAAHVVFDEPVAGTARRSPSGRRKMPSAGGSSTRSTSAAATRRAPRSCSGWRAARSSRSCRSCGSCARK